MAASTGPSDPKEKLGRERSLANLNRKGRPKGAKNVFSKADRLFKVQCAEVFRSILGFEDLENGEMNPRGQKIRTLLCEMLEGKRVVDPNYVKLVDKISILAFGRPPIQKQAEGPRRYLTIVGMDTRNPANDPMREQTDRMIRELEAEEERHRKLKDPTFDVIEETETPEGDLQIVRGRGDT